MNIEEAMEIAIHAARPFVGATSPNPPVGAVILDQYGEVIGVGAHEKAGLAHAEINAIEDCKKRDKISHAHTIVVTLEPCNHTGKTPPCASTILNTSIKRVAFGLSDPNPLASGGGVLLQSRGIEVVRGVLKKSCEALTEGFLSSIIHKRPFITVKRALDQSGTMIPPEGQKTFTSEKSLEFAHQLRKESDALITGSGTVLADNPEFTVRRVLDHPGKVRPLVLFDRRGRVPREWIQRAEKRGLQVFVCPSVEESVRLLHEKGCLKALVEAGPRLSEAFLQSPFWDRHVEIFKGDPDRIEVTERKK